MIYRINYVDGLGNRCIQEVRANSVTEAQYIFYMNNSEVFDIISIRLVGTADVV